MGIGADSSIKQAWQLYAQRLWQGCTPIVLQHCAVQLAFFLLTLMTEEAGLCDAMDTLFALVMCFSHPRVCVCVQYSNRPITVHGAAVCIVVLFGHKQQRLAKGAPTGQASSPSCPLALHSCLRLSSKSRHISAAVMNIAVCACWVGVCVCFWASSVIVAVHNVMQYDAVQSGCGILCTVI